MAGTNGPWWSFSPGTDSPAHIERDEDHDGGPRMLALVLAYIGVVLLIGALGCRAWAQEADAQQRAYCAQVADAPTVPSYCGEGK